MIENRKHMTTKKYKHQKKRHSQQGPLTVNDVMPLGNPLLTPSNEPPVAQEDLASLEAWEEQRSQKNVMPCFGQVAIPNRSRYLIDKENLFREELWSSLCLIKPTRKMEDLCFLVRPPNSKASALSKSGASAFVTIQRSFLEASSACAMSKNVHMRVSKRRPNKVRSSRTTSAA